jgi:hypothetical protein
MPFPLDEWLVGWRKVFREERSSRKEQSRCGDGMATRAQAPDLKGSRRAAR